MVDEIDAFEMMKKLVKKVGAGTLTPELKDKLKACVPDSKVVMGRAKRGLYAGRHIQYGNRVSEDGGNKSRRCWKPNVQEKRLFSYIFNRHIKVKVTTHTRRKSYGDKGGEEKGEEEASLEAGGLESHQDDHGWLEANTF
ncbi:hypothetical protein Bca4012_007871 [Brassica carinata]|uniref:Uncharacterized protein n=1 Tax=Brassica carinata TaxID=52824 RepID=A0A8X7RPS8_BRACI|nr:hypothetical protein Bca52824_038566 [Brassica carinata]